MPHTAYIGIGSNLESPTENCLKAVQRLNAHADLTVVARSSLYQSEPFGITDQDWFVNSVAQITTSLSPEELLRACLSIEQAMGRTRTKKWGPRIIDLDILFYDDLILKQEELEIPHPGIAERSFVLAPMNEIAPEFIHPKLKKSIQGLLIEVPNPQKVNRISSDG
ncbi:MAG: 2-amino-4-hydroxy-6-hydroxymethyldihydropteridine diphosphokinase [Nitrospinaceae bacterium]